MNQPFPILATWRRIVVQLGCVALLSLGLGMVFNAANPIGVRWSDSLVAQNSAAPSVIPSPVAPASPTADSSAPKPEPSAGAGPVVGSIHWPEVKPLMEAGQIVLVDSRPAKTFNLYRIPGAVSLPYDSDEETFAAFSDEYDKESQLVIYCAGGTCKAATLLTEKLIKLGYTHLRIMEEGYFGWLAQTKGESSVQLSKNSDTLAPAATNLAARVAPLAMASPAEERPSEKAPDPPAASPGDDSAPNPSPTTWELANPLFQQDKILLVDVRHPKTFKAGHIPGAVNLPESTSKEADYLAFREQYGTSTPVVLYCSSLTCSVSKRVALRLAYDYGFKNVRYLTGGFQRWQQAQLSTHKPNS